MKRREIEARDAIRLAVKCVMTCNGRLAKGAITDCYTSTQNTCTRLVQITSRDVHKYAIVASSATTQ